MKVVLPYTEARDARPSHDDIIPSREAGVNFDVLAAVAQPLDNIFYNALAEGIGHCMFPEKFAGVNTASHHILVTGKS